MHINSVHTEIRLSESMKKFQLVITQNVEKYCNYNVKEKEDAFEEIWKEVYGIDDNEEENQECKENFIDLYSIFRMESSAVENQQDIFSYFSSYQFRMDIIINSLEREILSRFMENYSVPSEQFIIPINYQHVPINEMLPYNGKQKYSYLCQKSLYETERTWYNFKLCIVTMTWIPVECEDLLQCCSGLYNYPDIIWRLNKNTQINILKSILRDPDDLEK